ncbi:polysaccharide deacetylase family protein [Mesorhizobium sp. BH1-1-4]|uniref:polysaccharide deacetylase family protein n=1 Tax=Mesorhizobium sp. BH1-1-4 TaxID=2876662 RepID=UPI001CD1155A|nr:polysaccharide deacetylase family protein [Mesorhizobium sp. BH1-1-4]MBZ9993090.1 polysaccharide deacetylase family protein [Mesorhizobium sp. BH1-1-4]
MLTFARRNPRIVNFHGIGVPARELEPGEASYWVSLHRFRDILDRIVCHPDRALVSITFDDGNISDLATAAPELVGRGLDAEIFVLTGRLGQRGSLSVDDIAHLLRLGMRIGNHGYAHSDWTKLTSKQLDAELVASKARLEEICGVPIHSAAIPFGRYNSAVLRALRRAGYDAVYSSDGGCVDTLSYPRPRTSIRQDMSDTALDNILSGQLQPTQLLRRNAAMAVKRWI